MNNWKSLEHPDCVTRVYHFASLASTNDWARQYLAEHRLAADETILVVADRQTAGRGRGNHKWWSPNGLLAFSLLVPWQRMGFSRETSAALSEHVAQAVQDTIVKQIEMSTQKTCASWREAITIKPPNDILAFKKKMAGILIESPNVYDMIIGIGINVNNDISQAPEDIRCSITSIKDITKQETDLSLLAERFIQRLYITYLD